MINTTRNFVRESYEKTILCVSLFSEASKIIVFKVLNEKILVFYFEINIFNK